MVFMEQRRRVYVSILAEHLRDNRQMAFVSGPRQVGKTTVCRSMGDVYLNWDNADDRVEMLKGPSAMAKRLQLDRVRSRLPVAVLDELHKYSKWKNLLKGFFDTYEKKVRLLVTGSSRLDVYRRGGDSLMGRYFLYRMHPWSVGECLNLNLPESEIRLPQEILHTDWDALWEHGGFPEPFLRRDSRFTRRWRSLRSEQLSREDLREVSKVSDLGTIEVLMSLLESFSSQQIVYSNLAREIQVSTDTVRRWIDLLERVHFGFRLRPWFKNVSKSLRKEPKWFVRDWSGIEAEGARAETMIACHLLKAVEGWNDLGFGEFELRYVRDKQKREVDFLVVRNGSPWFLVETKLSDTRMSSNLPFFQQQLKVSHAFQVVLNLPFESVDVFKKKDPVVVPAKTLLSQLL